MYINVRRQVNVRSAHCKFLPWALRLVTFAAGGQREEDECGDRATEWISAGRQINLWATELNPISHFLALLGARPKVHISRIKVNLPLWRGAF